MNKIKEVENINFLYGVLEDCENKISDKFEELNELLIKQYTLNRDIKSKVNLLEKTLETKAVDNKDGITIDYKTFSDIVNILSFAIPYNLCDKKFVDNLINMGMQHEHDKEKNLVKENNSNNNNKIQCLNMKPQCLNDNNRLKCLDDDKQQCSSDNQLNEQEIINILSEIFLKKILKNN